MLDFSCSLTAKKSKFGRMGDYHATRQAILNKPIQHPCAAELGVYKEFSALVVPKRGVLKILAEISPLLRNAWRAMEDVSTDPCWICFAEAPSEGFVKSWLHGNEATFTMIQKRLQPPPNPQKPSRGEAGPALHCSIGLEASRAGQFELALPLLEEAVNTENRSPILWHAVGRSRAATGNDEGAVRAYMQAIFLSQNWLDPMLALVALWLKQQQWEALLWLSPRILRVNPLDDAALFALGLARYRSGDLLGALGPLRKSVDLCPERIRAWQTLGCLYQDLRDYIMAASAMLHALINGAEEAVDLNNFGYMLAEIGELEPAEDYVSKALVREPSHPAFLDSMGYVRLRQGRVDEAIKYFEAAVAENPQFVDGWNHIALCYAWQHAWIPARDALRQARIARAGAQAADPQQPNLPE